jgi:hypothetical protein
VLPDRVRFFSLAKKAISSEVAFFYSGRKAMTAIKPIEMTKLN